MRLEDWISENLQVRRMMKGYYIVTPRLTEGANVTLSTPCFDTDMLNRAKVLVYFLF